jgi:hypothetical protein
MYNSAYWLTLYVVITGMKWADLVKWSTMTHMELYPDELRGKPTMKSMQISSHFHSGMLNDCGFPTGWPALTLQHVSHSATYLTISHFILVHQKFFFKSWYILFVHGWIEYLEQCASSTILWRSSKSLGTTRQFLNHRTPSTSSWKHFTSSNFNLLQMWPILTYVFWATMTSSLIDGMRAMLFNAPYGMTRRLDSSRSPPDVRGWTTIWCQCSFWLRASVTTFALPGW